MPSTRVSEAAGRTSELTLNSSVHYESIVGQTQRIIAKSRESLIETVITYKSEMKTRAETMDKSVCSHAEILPAIAQFEVLQGAWD